MAFQSFPTKDPQEVLDYAFDFSDLISEGLQLDVNGHSVAIESVSPPEDILSPDTRLAFFGSPAPLAIPLEATSPLRRDAIQIWLVKGQVGRKYTIVCRARDTNPSPTKRIHVRRATLKVKKL